MIIKLLPFLFVLIGITGLCISLLPTKKICEIKHDQSLGWKILGALMVFFVCGYLAFGLLLFDKQPGLLELIVSMILCGGGIFVAMVTRMTMLTIQHINRIAALERHRALHDELTDLPNRTLLYERIHYAIIEAERHCEPLAVIMMDLDRFKEINDALGHHYGDYLLQLIAPRMQKSVRETDTVSRLGGDEFAIVLPGVGLDDAILLAKKIAANVEQPFLIEGRKINLNITSGIAIYPKHGEDSETLLRHADVAMYTAKRSSDKYAIYSVEQDEYTINRLMLTEELRTAINHSQLFLLYQPIIDLKKNRMHGTEVLVRWRHPDHEEAISPDDFISLAEQTGLIEQLTYWVLEKAFEQMKVWQKAGTDFRTSINISAKCLYDFNFPKNFKKLLKKWQIPPHMLTLEITETSVMTNPDRAFTVISDLVGLGVNFSIDDFGTGYFPFASLKQVPVKEVKIDRSFVMGMLKDENDAAIVRTTIDLANSMGLRAIAEGIEDAATLEKVFDLGCFIGQGFYLCPPIPAEKVLTLAQQEYFFGKDLQELRTQPCLPGIAPPTRDD